MPALRGGHPALPLSPAERSPRGSACAFHSAPGREELNHWQQIQEALGEMKRWGGGRAGGVACSICFGRVLLGSAKGDEQQERWEGEQRVRTKGFKANEERQHPSQQTPTSHYEHCMDNSRAQGTARDIGVSGSIPGTHAVPPPWAPSMGQLVGVLQPDKEEQAEAPNTIFPPKGACKRLTLQDQGDHRHCCARLILCHAAVKPHNSTLMSKHH